MKNEKIYIIGYGAIGKALAVFLTSLDKKVVVVRGSFDDNSKKYDDIAVELADGEIMTRKIEVVTFKTIDKLEGLVILTTKSFGNTELSKLLRPLVSNAPIVLLQNGLNVEKPFLDNHFDNIYRCVLFATSQVLENGMVRFRPVADSPIGIVKGNYQTLNNVTAQIDSQYFHFKTERAIQPIIWKKAIINTVFNSLCPLLNTDNGIFHKDPLALQLAQRIIGAGITIAEKSNVILNKHEVESNLINISKASDGQLISTLQDLNNGRKTEIESLNFEISKIATLAGISSQATEIKLLGELIKIKEQLNQKHKNKT